jgi:hypothetical protein
MTRIYNFFLFLLLSLVFALIVLTNKSYSAEKYVCSIWQASSFQIVDRVNDLSRCNDLYYENSDSENYQLFSRYSNTILSNETYANLKKKIKNGVSFNVNAAETEGCKKGNCVNGQGTYTFAGGEKYVGEWKDNKKHGQGTLTFAGGDKYVGEFKDGQRNGQGTYTFANGEKYVGEFKDDKYYQGTYTFANGNKYVGEFKDNQKNGQGTLTYVDGSYCTGIFENDKCLSDIVKADPNKNKPKKKVEVAKVEEPKQKESSIKVEMIADVYEDNKFIKTTNFGFRTSINLKDKEAYKWIYLYVFNNTTAACKYIQQICIVTTIKFTDLNNSKNNKIVLNKEGFKQSASLFDILNANHTQITKLPKPKQEEFKPVNKDVDNQAPIIDIADSVTVNNQTFTLKGKVTDKSKLYIEANNRPLTVAKNGEFKLEGFVVDPEAGEQIKLVAIDQWQNKSEKIIKINVEFKDVAELRSYADPNPNKIKVKEDKNKIAIIIGIEKYRFLKNIDAPYANRDANAFRAYANRALGISNKNIKILIDENATRGETLKALTLWLPQAAKGKNKDIYIFFAGHGLASDDGKNLYILPQDGDAALLQYTAISRLEMFELINKVEPNSVTMFFDTCYSGQTRDEEMLVAGLRPIRLTAEEQDTPNNFTIFTASNYDQTSGSINQAKHGIFSYYLMKGMEGQADSNQDKKITNGELIAYLKQNVSEEAFINNRQQEPMLSGDPDKVLISYN